MVLLSFGCNVQRQGANEYKPNVSKGDRAKAVGAYEAFLEQAVYHGAKRDGLSKEFVEILVKDNSLWVGKCPICMNVEDGFREYMAEASGTGIPAPFAGADTQTKKRFLQQMVDDYVQWYFTVLKVTDAERKALEEGMKDGRERGMSLANGGEGFFCASCDGACHKPQ